MSTQDPQDSSLFFQKLPPEIRLEIYSHVFYSTRLSFGCLWHTSLDSHRNFRLRPAPNSLSALRVCRRFNDEIGDSWLGQVLFSFSDSETMLDKLADLDRQTMGKLRHLRYMCEHQLELETQIIEDGEYQERNFHLPEVLKLLHGLHLDRLTVVGPSIAQVGYTILDTLINHSDGWKELYHISHNSMMLGFGKFDKMRGDFEWIGDLRAPQPSTWIQALAARDGPTASVTIYRSTDAALSGTMIPKPSTCQAFADQYAEPGKESQYGIESDTALMTPGEKGKEILVVAKRGKGVDYTENGTSPLMEHDIREYWPGMTWGQIRYMGIDWHDERRGHDSDDDDDDDDDDWDAGFDKLIQDLKDIGMLDDFKEAMRPTLEKFDRLYNSDLPEGTEVDENGFPILIKEDTYIHVDDYEWGPHHTTNSPD